MSLSNPENEQLIDGDVFIPYERNPAATFQSERVGYFRNANHKFGRMMNADYYAKPPSINKESYHFLNSASLPSPVAEVRDHARGIFEMWARGELTDERKQEILAEARREAATLVNMKDERGVVLCRNASEALSYFLWLSGIMENVNPPYTWPLVVSTDAENPSIQREIFIIQDHSNADRKDTITTYAEFGSQRPLGYSKPTPQATQLRWGHFNVFRATNDKALEHLEDMIQDQREMGVLILSHVSRSTGRKIDVKTWTEKARIWKKKYHPGDPELFVVIDGAQALGNIEVDVGDLGCDMYVGCGQKALQGETVGLLYIDPENPKIKEGLEHVRTLAPDKHIVLRGMFHDDLGVPANVDDDVSYPDIAGFTENIKRLQKTGMVDGNNLMPLIKHRSKLRESLAQGLMDIKRDLRDDLTLLDEENCTSFILSFRFGPDPFLQKGAFEHGYDWNPEGVFEPGAMHANEPPTESWGKTIAQKLDQKGIGIAFLRRGNVFRVSFSDRNTNEDVQVLLKALREVLVETHDV